jgi:hypothetical protein
MIHLTGYEETTAKFGGDRLPHFSQVFRHAPSFYLRQFGKGAGWLQPNHYVGRTLRKTEGEGKGIWSTEGIKDGGRLQQRLVEFRLLKLLKPAD